MTHDQAATRTAWRRWLPHLLTGVAAVAVFMAHFRPWEVGFLEEWALADMWMHSGPAEFAANFFEWSLSRPLHLVPTAIGLALTGGTPFGIWFVMGAVAVGQFLVVLWALRPYARSVWVSGAVALFVALHPLWPGGFLQRFLPAQTAALALFVAAGLLIRWLLQGRVRWIVWAGVTVVLGLCVYPGIALAAPLLALVVSLAVQSSWRRRVIAVAVVVAAVGAVTLYSFVLSNLFVARGATYESSNLQPGALSSPRGLVVTIGTVLLDKGLVLVVGVLLIAVLGAVLALTGSVPHWGGWLLTGTAAVSIACALVFFGNSGWLSDIERIAYATSLGLGIALLVWPITALGSRPRIEVAIAVVLIAFTLLGAARGIHRWQPYIALQHQLFEEIAPAMREATGDEIVVVVDRSGTFGTEYTLPQYYISSAARIVNSDQTPVWLCSGPQDPPLEGAGQCDRKDIGEELRRMTSFEVPNGRVDVYIATPPESE